jgi:hypothetical protein
MSSKKLPQTPHFQKKPPPFRAKRAAMPLHPATGHFAAVRSSLNTGAPSTSLNVIPGEHEHFQKYPYRPSHLLAFLPQNIGHGASGVSPEGFFFGTGTPFSSLNVP